MNKLFAIFALLLLVGGGCATTAPEAEQLTDTIKSVPSATITSDDGTVFNVDASGTVTEKTDNGVPIIDIVLGGETARLVEMKSGNFFFEPNVITATPGESIKVKFVENSGFHTFVIDEVEDLKYPIKENGSVIFAAPSEPGEYTFYCDIGSHRAQGQVGTLIVK